MSVLADGVRHPKIYAYTLDRYADMSWEGPRTGSGLMKVGYTEKDAEVRIREQLYQVKMPTSVQYDVLLVERAITDDGHVFTDHAVHKALQRKAVHRRLRPRQWQADGVVRMHQRRTLGGRYRSSDRPAERLATSETGVPDAAGTGSRRHADSHILREALRP